MEPSGLSHQQLFQMQTLQQKQQQQQPSDTNGSAENLQASSSDLNDDCASETALVTNPIQRSALYIIESPYFEPFIMAIICANVFTLALHDPLLGDHEGRNEPLFQCGKLLSSTAFWSALEASAHLDITFSKHAPSHDVCESSSYEDQPIS